MYPNGCKEGGVMFTKEEWEGLEIGLIARIKHLEEWPAEHGHDKISDEDQAIIEWNRKLLNKVAALKAK